MYSLFDAPWDQKGCHLLIWSADPLEPIHRNRSPSSAHMSAGHAHLSKCHSLLDFAVMESALCFPL